MLPVYDSINKERLLGHHPRWPGPEPYYRFAAMHMLSARCFDINKVPEICPSVRYVEFRRDYRYSENGWKVEPILLTYAPLSDLMLLRDFTLPDETERAAYERRDRAAYGR
jgi:hypothetical protein